jgi:hypothetical protein
MKECQGNRRHRTKERVSPAYHKGEQRTVEGTNHSIYALLYGGTSPGKGEPGVEQAAPSCHLLMSGLYRTAITERMQ